MKIFKLWLIAGSSLISLQSIAQKSPEKKYDKNVSNFSVTAGAGIANYFGDLIEGNNYFSQPNYSFSLGATYTVSKHFSARLDLGIQKVQAADRKNKREDFKARNLSFKSNVFDLSLAAEYNMLDGNKYMIVPYISAGIGLVFFAPYAYDVTGKKYSLRELGTDGQGLAGYPGLYNNIALEFPIGFGFKYPLSENVNVQFEFNYRFTRTDYLDDVSKNRYPDKALLDAKKPLTSQFTWRGYELGGEPYPKNLNLPRGNPNNKDGYYTTQIKIAINLPKN